MPQRFQRAGPRRKTQWAGLGNSTGAAAIPTAIALVAGTPLIISQAAVVAGGTGIVDEEFTITRTICDILLATRVNTAELAVSVAIGCAVARAEAITAGVASLPSPESDPDFEWIFYGVGLLLNPIAAEEQDGGSLVRMHVDVKGQRIVRAGQSIVWIAESQGGNASAGVAGRYLVKLT